MTRRRTWSWLAVLVLAIMAMSPAGCKKKSTTQDAVQPAETSQSDAALVELNNRGVGQMGRFEYAAARETFEEVVAARAEWQQAKVNLAIATFNRQQDGDEDAGLSILEEVLAADSANLNAQYCVGLLRLIRGETALALELFRVVVERDPTDGYAAYFVGQCLEGEDDEAALDWFQRAIRIDSYLRSAYYRSFQCLQRLGRADEAREAFAVFQQLETNPRAKLVEIKYSRMGSKAMAKTIDEPGAEGAAVRPEGPIFEEPVKLLTNGEAAPWKKADWQTGRGPSMTACDIDDDGDLDVFIADALAGAGVHNAVCINNGDGTFTLDSAHPLAPIESVRAVLWGDYDNDGLTDAYFCRDGANALWRYDGAQSWSDVTAATGTAGGAFDSLGGAIFDADHDGDLDVFCVNANGPNELFNNNLDGTFTPIAQQQGIAGSGRGSRQVLPVDLDADRDTDLVVLNAVPPHDVFLNDRLWQYRPGDGFDDMLNANLLGVLARDEDVDGHVELVGRLADGRIITWRRDAAGAWSAQSRTGDTSPPVRQPEVYVPGDFILLTDFSGDGRGELVVPEKGGWMLHDSRYWATEQARYSAWCAINLDPLRGPSMVAVPDGGEPSLWRPGPGRLEFAALSVSGREDTAESMRSNASGIGTRINIRIDSRWSAASTFPMSTGPGQSLQPVAIGLGGAKSIDFIELHWSDGVMQTELQLAAGQTHHVVETQRQLSSCPVLFAWNGSDYAFVSDLLGVGGMGYMVAPHEYAPPRPWERFLMPASSMAPREGRYEIKLMEPMEEVCYLDAAVLEVWDLPPGWQMVIDDRMNIAGPEPTGEAIFYREEWLPTRATNSRGEDVTAAITGADGLAAAVGLVDPRFIGRLADSHRLTLEFDREIDSLEAPVLVADGWVEYPYSQTMFGAWQAHAAYEAPTLEARDGSGAWHVVFDQFGYPAGMPRRMALPLGTLPHRVTALRLSTNQEIYWDRISIVDSASCSNARRVRLSPARAELSEPGFPERITHSQKRPDYDYSSRSPLWDTKSMAGWYTPLGDVTSAVSRADQRLVVFGPGDEVHIEFDGSHLGGIEAGWSRRFVIDVQGWCKDMDLFTKDGDTVDPMPCPPPGSDSLRSESAVGRLRYRSGR